MALETRKHFQLLNGWAIVLAPLLVLLGRFLGENAGWMVVLFLFGGFLVVSGCYLFLFLWSFLLPRGPLSRHRALVWLWWLGVVGTTLTMWLVPDADGDGPDSGTHFGPLNDISDSLADKITLFSGLTFLTLGLASFLGWCIVVVMERRRHDSASQSS